MKKLVLVSAIASALAMPLVVQAEDAPPSPLTGNLGIFSNYIFRGVTQTTGAAAVQGGFDYAHPSGLYVGTWGSNVSWLTDGGYATGSSLELDVYGGYKGAFGKTDFGYDVGAIFYYYPGKEIPTIWYSNLGTTTEVYGALSWKWLSAKLSYAASDYFGNVDSKGTLYADISASYPIGKTGVTVLAHVGYLKAAGNSAYSCFYVPGGSVCSNDDALGYTDWKVGASYALPKDFTVGAYYTDTNNDTGFYNIRGKDWADRQAAVYIQKTF